MLSAYLTGSFSGQTATANRGMGRFDSLQKQQGLIEKTDQGSQCCIYWSAGAAGGGATDVAGRLPSSASAIGWKCLCAVLRHLPVFRLFSDYFLSMDFADIENLGGWVTNSREHGVTCAHGTRGLCACTYHSAPPCLRCNVAIQV